MPEIKRLHPLEAAAALKSTAGAVLIDVRDPLEFALVGHPAEAINIPWKYAPDWRTNPQFIEQVRQTLSSFDVPVFLLCRSGQRSLDAAGALAEAGYRNLTNIEHGFEGPLDGSRHRSTLGGWRFHGLPWEQT